MKKKTNQTDFILYKIAKIVVILVLSVILLINLWLLYAKHILNEELSDVFGWSSIVVMSNSMEPVFSSGDMLVFKEQAYYKVDDIICFQSEGVLVTHRIIGIEDGNFVTKGDANDAQDSKLIPLNQVEGKMIRVFPKIGNYLRFAIIPLVLFIIIALTYLSVELPKAYKKRRLEGPKKRKRR